MPLRSKYQFNREGLTADTVGRLIRRTALNPFLTLPLWLAAHYTDRGRALAAQHLTERSLKVLRVLLALGAFRFVNSFLDAGVTNNWSNDVYDWSKEVVVVTGGSDGIGAHVVKLLAEKGIKVAVLDIQALKYDCPATVSFFKCDLTSSESISSVTYSIRSTLGEPTILINNAGVAFGKSILDTSERDLNLTFRVNTFAHFFLTQAFLPSMVQRNHGMIVTVASAAGFVTAPNMVDYAGSKAAAVAFHEGLSAELATVYNAPKVRTVLVAQGYTRTALFQGFKSGDPFVNYTLYPETVAEEIVKAVLAGRSRTLFLPGVGRYVSMKLRGWSEWLQYSTRKRTVELMKGWHGRQVVQPSEEKGVGVVKSEAEFGEESLVVGEKE